MTQRQPGGIVLAAVDALLNEVHAFDTVVDVWVDRVDFFERFTFGSENHRVVGGAVDVCKGFEKRLGMTARESAGRAVIIIGERSVWIAS